MRLTEQDKTYQRELIWNNLIKIINEKKNTTDESCLLRQIKFINKSNICSKNKFKSVDILNNYLKNQDKHMAQQIFWNTIKNKI